jgi:hypothetical protein
MTPRTTSRTAAFALAVAAVLTPTALAKPVPMPDGPNMEVAATAAATRLLKPSLQSTTPDTMITLDLYLSALAGTATTSE